MYICCSRCAVQGSIPSTVVICTQLSYNALQSRYKDRHGLHIVRLSLAIQRNGSNVNHLSAPLIDN